MSISNYLENAICNVLKNTTLTGIANVYVQLHTGDPGEDGTSNVLQKTGPTNYDRSSAISLGTVTNGVVSTNANISWTNLDLETSPSTISYVSLWDAASAGNCLWISNVMSPTVAVADGDTFTITSGNLTITVT
jgi:hypothetical protein